MKKVCIILFLVVLAHPVQAQNFFRSTQHIFTYATLPGAGATPGPAVCSVGDVGFQVSDGSYYGCATANTWTALGGAGGVSCPSCTNNVIPKTNVSGTSLQDSSLTDNGTTVSTTELFSAAGNITAAGGVLVGGVANTTAGQLRLFNTSGIRSFRIQASTPAAADRTIDFNWSALTATRTWTVPNGNVDFTPLVTPIGTGSAVLGTGTKGTCTLDGTATPTCTATVISGCTPVCTYNSSSAIHIVACSVASTTLTAASATATDSGVVNWHCF